MVPPFCSSHYSLQTHHPMFPLPLVALKRANVNMSAMYRKAFPLPLTRSEP